jgi:hypothetical protein
MKEAEWPLRWPLSWVPRSTRLRSVNARSLTLLDYFSLGRHGQKVSALGLGCMGTSWGYGQADRAESIATIRGALDAGVGLLDTGDFYGMVTTSS